MKLTYKTQEKDFIDFYLYTTLKSESIKKKRRNSVTLFTIIPIALALYFFWNDKTSMTFYFAAIAVACFILYPKYFDWRYKKHFQYFVKENLSDRFNESTELEIKDKKLFSRDQSGEGKIKLSEIDEINETQNHFFIQGSTGMSLVIPKRELDSPEAFKAELVALGLRIE